MRLHPDSGWDQGLMVIYDSEGDVLAQGYLDVGDDGVVRFVNVLSPAQLAPSYGDDPAA